MNKKIIGILVMMLLVATTVPAVTCMNNTKLYTISSKLTQSCPQDIWNEIQKLTASDGETDDWFGISISISGDTAIIGTPAVDNFKGSAYIFTRNGTTWTQQAKLPVSDVEVGDNFGFSVSLSGDTALIGAAWDDENKADSGSAYIFTRTGATWTQQAKLISSDIAKNDKFGYSVSLDSDTALIGAIGNDDNGVDSGSAYIFTRTDTTWTQQAKLPVSDGDVGDNFGFSVSLSGDTALIGAAWDDENKADSGSAYIFTRTGATWTQQAKLIASDVEKNDYFGYSVSLDGNTALIGVQNDDDNGESSGSAYIFTRTGATWTQQAKLIASDGAADDWFGRSVSISGDTALITAEYDDDNGEDSGSVYVFTRNDIKWIQQQKLLASDGAEGDLFGRSVCINDEIAFIGAYMDDDNGEDSGSVYVFAKNKPPEKPTIIGETSGKPNIEYEYKFISADPDGDNIEEYFIDWGDNSGELSIGPYSSGVEASAKHNWSEKGDYTIKAKARDIYGAESEWATLAISMPKVYFHNSVTQLIMNLLERFPMFKKILNKII